MFDTVCRVERSTDQVMKPVNTEALSKWVGNIPPDVMSDMAEIAPMLARLGYDPHASPPDYTKPDPKVSPYNNSQVKLEEENTFLEQLRFKPMTITSECFLFKLVAGFRQIIRYTGCSL